MTIGEKKMTIYKCPEDILDKFDKLGNINIFLSWANTLPIKTGDMIEVPESPGVTTMWQYYKTGFKPYLATNNNKVKS